MSRLIAYLLLGSIFFLGCRKITDPTSTSVTGTVTYQGIPLSGGTITFTPDTERGSRGAPLSATIQTNGKFTLLKEDGSPPPSGYYRIAVAARAGAFPDPTPEDPYPGPPKRYRNPEKSNLFGHIQSGSENYFDIQLVD
jgi:hypothetical protein